MAPLMAQPYSQLQKTKINDHITLQLPESFSPLNEQEVNKKFISYRKPLAIYSDPGRVVDFGINVSVTQWGEEDLPLMKDFFKSTIYSLYDTIEMIDERITEVNDRPFVVFEFLSSVKSEDNAFMQNNDIHKYSYLQYALVNGKTLLFNFTCPAGLRSKWDNVADEMMKSIEIKNSF